MKKPIHSPIVEGLTDENFDECFDELIEKGYIK